MLIKGGTVFDSVHGKYIKEDIKIENGVIKEVASGLTASTGEEVLDATDKIIYPGLIDAHSHLGLDNDGCGWEGTDENEMGDIVSPELRGLDSFNPQDPAMKKSLEAGITCVGTGPGSANVLGGTFVAMKTFGECADDMIVKNPVAMKCAFGENPKRCYKEKGDSARMTTAAKLREMLLLTKEYIARKEAAADDVLKAPKFDMKLEALIPVIKREIPLKAHCHRADDICTAIRIAREFNVLMTLEHVTDGHLIADEIAASGFPAAVGPSLTSASKLELQNKTFKTPGVLSKAGVQVSIVTDNPVIPQKYLPVCAALAVKDGMDKTEAIKAITINPAKHLGIEGRVGSIEVGKDADIIICSGDILSIETRVEHVLTDGVVRL